MSMTALGRVASSCAFAGIIFALSGSAAPADGAWGPESGRPRAGVAFSGLPLSFEANAGQASAEVRFLARGPGYVLALGSGDATLWLRSRGHRAALRMRLAGANPAAEGAGEERLGRTVTYIIGKDPSAWRSSIPTYARLRYRAVYPGIDLVYYGNHGQLEYDFVVAPGAEPAAIRLVFEGAEAVTLDRGDLVLGTSAGFLRMTRPLLYQEVDGIRRTVDGRYRLEGHEVGFVVGDYDRSRPLVIDPLTSYFNDLGGSADDTVVGILDAGSGRVYVAGTTTSADLPGGVGASVDASANGSQDVFVAELEPSTGAVVRLTYLGGSGEDRAVGLARDATGHIYVAGWTGSADFPTTPGAVVTTFRGRDAFVAKLDSTLSTLVYSTLFPASVSGIAVDASGHAYVAGSAGSDLPTTPGAFQTTFRGGAHPSGNPQYGTDAFVAKLNPSGSALVYSTYLGTGGSEGIVGIGVDPIGQAVVTGSGAGLDFPHTTGPTGDAFITKFTADGSGLVYSTAVGREFSGKYAPNSLGGIAVDGAGAAYVLGAAGFYHAGAFGIVTTPGAFQESPRGGSDLFVVKFDPAGAVVYATYLAGSGWDGLSGLGGGIAVDQAGRAWVTASTSSADFPTAVPCAAAGCHADTTLDGSSDGFVAILDPAGSSLVYGAFLGGSGVEAGAAIAIQEGDFALVGGLTTSADFWSGGYRGGASDGFVARLRVAAPPPGPPPPPGPVSLALALNRAAFAPGDLLEASVTLANPGAALLVDVFAGALLPPAAGPALGCPLGDAIAFLADQGTRVAIACRSASAASFAPFARATPIAAALPATTVALASVVWPPGAPAGAYTLFLVLTPVHAFTDGSAAPGDLLAIATAGLTFTP